jgi:c-di-GMP-binding flagellar brake protein YcgR
LSIPWPTDRGIRLIAHPGDVLDFYFIRGGTPHIFSGVVERTERGPLPQIAVIIDGPAQQIQRRQNYRVKCLLPIQVVGTLPEDPANESSATLIIKTVSSDLSAGGISFRSARKIPEGTLLNIKLSIPDNGPPISASCSVIYSEFVSEHQTLYRTALRYIVLSEGERARIVRFIYRIQLRGLHP